MTDPHIAALVADPELTDSLVAAWLFSELEREMA